MDVGDDGAEADAGVAEMATFLGELDEAGGQFAPDADVVAAATAVEEEKAEPRRIAGSALAAKMLAPEASPLLAELSQASTGLDDGYYRQVFPAQSIRTKDPRRVRFRAAPWLCDAVGLPSPLSDKDLIKCFGTWEARPMPRLSMAYMGYQFGVLNKGLGDGRAFVWGQWHNQPAPALPAASSFPELWEMGTKGSGKTPFSRGHDGLLTLQGAVREVIGAAALGAAGVRTTQVLAIIETEGVVLRGIPAVGCAGAVLVRFARSFVRFGSFERLLNLSLTRAEQCKEIETLANYCLRHCYPELLDEDTQAGVKSAAEAETEEKDAEEAEAGAEERKTASIFRAFFAAVCQRTAAMCAGMMAEGFVHGVLNSDNLLISGEVLDYGPFSFLSVYDPDYVSASFDADGRYAFGRQVEACRWNLQRLGAALSLLPGVFRTPEALRAMDVASDIKTKHQIPLVEEVVEYEYMRRVEREYSTRICAKLGFTRHVKLTVAVAPNATVAEENRAQEGRETEYAKMKYEQHQLQLQRMVEEERQQQDYALARSTRALLRRGSICMHEFFSAVCSGMCAKWAEEPGEVLRGSSFEQCGISLAPKEWIEFQRRFAARLRLEAVLTTPSTAAIAICTSQVGGDVPAEQGRYVDASGKSYRPEVNDDLIESVRAECARLLLPVDMGSGVMDEVWRSIELEGDWRPFDALVRALADHSSRRHDHAFVTMHL